MPSICMKPIGGTRMRVTKLDSCGAPVVGGSSCFVVSSGFVSVERTAEYEDPVEIVVLNGNGDICLKDRRPPQFKWMTFNITFCEVDPEVYNLITGSPIVLNDATPTPSAVGWRTREGPAGVGSTHFALEVWTRLAQEPCSATNQPYGYYLAPWVSEGVPGDVTFGDGGSAVSFSMTQAKTNPGSPWGTGPATYLVRRDAMTGTPEVLLTAITSTDHDHFERVTVAPPTALCGCQALA